MRSRTCSSSKLSSFTKQGFHDMSFQSVASLFFKQVERLAERLDQPLSLRFEENGWQRET